LHRLRDAILENPDDTELRRVYADALIGRGDPRGELIQIQCDLEALPDGDPRRPVLRRRELQLLADHEAEWLEPFREWLITARFRRGMLERISARPDRFFDGGGAALFAAEPVTSLSLRGLSGSAVDRLAAFPFRGRLRALAVRESAVGAAVAMALSDARFDALAELDLYGSRGGAQSGNEILDGPVAPRLTSLVLSGNYLGPRVLERLLTSPRFPSLRALALGWEAKGPDGARLVRDRMALPAIERLDLACNQLGDEGLAILAEARWLERITSLRLERNELGPRGIEALAGSPHLGRLESLDLGTNVLGTDGARAFSINPWPSLRVLNLHQTALGDDGARAFAARAWPALSELILSYCGSARRGRRRWRRPSSRR
jgi:uncharacterized protein (TIGR02996 family)